ncbi:hypothetical protein [Acidovorax delafieldii]|uniref:hypothetical protein n=1 Tax=Acidovorax delafieldii TaxID=47920 RepID=UPI003ED0F13B
MSKERPILFSGPMVRALLNGSKTQTRRIVKGRAFEWLECFNFTPEFVALPDNAMCPYGHPGDRLWVRETFYCDHCFYPEGTPPICYWDADKPRPAHTPEQIQQERADMLDAMYYRADSDPEFEAPEGPTPWRPSIHMPRWASRITLEITGVRVERLQDISDADCVAEGCGALPAAIGCPMTSTPGETIPRAMFRALWESINGPDSWAANPWVWAIEFRRLP